MSSNAKLNDSSEQTCSTAENAFYAFSYCAVRSLSDPKTLGVFRLRERRSPGTRGTACAQHDRKSQASNLSNSPAAVLRREDANLDKLWLSAFLQVRDEYIENFTVMCFWIEPIVPLDTSLSVMPQFLTQLG